MNDLSEHDGFFHMEEEELSIYATRDFQLYLFALDSHLFIKLKRTRTDQFCER